MLVAGCLEIALREERSVSLVERVPFLLERYTSNMSGIASPRAPPSFDLTRDGPDRNVDLELRTPSTVVHSCVRRCRLDAGPVV